MANPELKNGVFGQTLVRDCEPKINRGFGDE